MPCNWKLLSVAPVPANIGQIAEELGITQVIAEVLWRRGFTSTQAMDRFLSPGLRHLPKPESIPGLTESARVLARELMAGARFCVWGDYDVDGITSTALVKDFFAKRLGPEVAAQQVRHYLPNRVDDGYGLNMAGIERLADDGVRLLLTVDCGISAVAEVARANELGMTVVVSDHHLPPAQLPPAAAICNPRLCGGDCGDACTGLCELAGVGVAFMLMAALNRLLPGDPLDMRQFLDLVALGTVADVVSLTGPNRILVKNGLLLIKDAKRPGIASLKVYSGYDRVAELGAGQIGFGLAPRINAAGRMADPQVALTMLLAPDMDTANPPGLQAGRPERQAPQRGASHSGGSPGPGRGAEGAPGPCAGGRPLAPRRHRHCGLARGGAALQAGAYALPRGRPRRREGRRALQGLWPQRGGIRPARGAVRA